MINYINALLADISYLDFVKSGNTYTLEEKEKNTFADRGISKSEENFISGSFEVIDHQSNTFNGFSATTFKVTTNKVPGYKQGDIIVAYRGTEGDKPAQVLPYLLITDVLNIGAGINNFSELFTTAVNKIISYVFPDKSISLTQADMTTT